VLEVKQVQPGITAGKAAAAAQAAIAGDEGSDAKINSTTTGSGTSTGKAAPGDLSEGKPQLLDLYCLLRMIDLALFFPLLTLSTFLILF
jgi:hypothetical protein